MVCVRQSQWNTFVYAKQNREPDLSSYEEMPNVLYLPWQKDKIDKSTRMTLATLGHLIFSFPPGKIRGWKSDKYYLALLEFLA